MPDPHEAARQDVEQEAPDELHRAQRHLFDGMAMRVVLIPEADQPIPTVQNPMIGHGNPVGIAAEIVEDLLRSCQGCLGVDDPFLLPQRRQETLPFHWILEHRAVALEDQLPSAIGRFQTIAELALKDLGQGVDGKEEAPFLARYPVFSIRTQAASRDDTVEMDMVAEVLAPGMEDGRHAEFCTQMFRIPRELLQRGDDGLEECGIQQSFIAAEQRIEHMGQSKNDVVVGHRE